MIKTNEDFLKRFYEKYPNDYEVISDYVNANTEIKIRHSCGYEFYKKPKNILSNKFTCNCPKCFSHLYTYVIPGISDMWTTNRELASLLKYKEDGYKYKANSNKKVMFICPTCGNEIFKSPNEVYRNGLQCTKCNDGMWYPEKFGESILKQLNIDYIKQYSPDWLKPYRYDFYFELNENKYILEMDGGLGHGNFNLDGTPDEKGKLNDELKDKLAEEHGINVIRIDCNYVVYFNRFNYIKSHVENSKELNFILDLSKVNFGICNKDAESSYFVKVCDLIQNGEYSISNIANKLNISYSSALRYAKDACNSGYLDIEYSELSNRSKEIGKEKSHRSNLLKPNGFGKKAVKCIETGQVFNSLKEASEYCGKDVYNYFYYNKEYCGILPDGTKLHWEKLVS